MAKLVILNQGMTGRAYELHMDRTTIGRVEDNTFQIADAVRFQPSLRSPPARQRHFHPRPELHQRHLHQRRKNHRKRFEARPDPASGPGGIEAGSGRRACRSRLQRAGRSGTAGSGQKTGGRHDAHAARREPGANWKAAAQVRRALTQTVFQEDQQGQQVFSSSSASWWSS